jgi:hypothetical protein
LPRTRILAPTLLSDRKRKHGCAHARSRYAADQEGQFVPQIESDHISGANAIVKHDGSRAPGQYFKLPVADRVTLDMNCRCVGRSGRLSCQYIRYVHLRHGVSAGSAQMVW